jgi:hypothetical protein
VRNFDYQKTFLSESFKNFTKEILYFINKEKRYREMKAKEIVEG